jgi:hypothetical protein
MYHADWKAMILATEMDTGTRAMEERRKFNISGVVDRPTS